MHLHASTVSGLHTRFPPSRVLPGDDHQKVRGKRMAESLRLDNELSQSEMTEAESHLRVARFALRKALRSLEQGTSVDVLACIRVAEAKATDAINSVTSALPDGDPSFGGGIVVKTNQKSPIRKAAP
jgi:hypothetical protein